MRTGNVAHHRFMDADDAVELNWLSKGLPPPEPLKEPEELEPPVAEADFDVLEEVDEVLAVADSIEVGTEDVVVRLFVVDLLLVLRLL
jgi:hypothetical protein